MKEKNFFSQKMISGIPRPAGKGARCIIIGMGNEQGWVDNSVDVWMRTAKDGVVTEDYHSDINAEGFTGWLKKALPSLPENSVLVFDNASYHSKKDENNTPTTKWRIDLLRKWLKAKKVDFDPNTKRPELYQMARMKAAEDPKYKVDQLIRDYGHEVLRLPPYHCDLNPIERI